MPPNVITLAAPPNKHSHVQVAGDFNNWQLEDMTYGSLGANNVWYYVQKGATGSIGLGTKYKLRVDGEWIIDRAMATDLDSSGHTNNIVNFTFYK